MPDGALAGIKVVEFGQMVAAPFCARLLADYGADVVKVEPPGGDMARRMPPFPGDEPHPEKSGTYFFLNTNKRGVTLDPDTERGRDLLRRLVRDADVLVENHLPSRMREWGLDYDSLAAENPNLVMISITPYGQTGPYAGWNGYDLNAYHLTAAGSRYLGNPDEEPLEPGTFAADFFAGAAAAAWGLAAFFGREQIGGGQQLDVSISETVASLYVGGLEVAPYLGTGVLEKRKGVGIVDSAPSAPMLRTTDGYIRFMTAEPQHWRAMSKAMGDPEWAQNELFLDRITREEHMDMIYTLVQEWTGERTKEEVMDVLQGNGNPTTAVFTPGELANHPQFEAREMVKEVDHPELGRIRDIGPPFQMKGSPPEPRLAAPLLGQHNAEVYSTGPGWRSAN